jgi:hypothetical protein
MDRQGIVVDNSGQQFLLLYEGQWENNGQHGDGLQFDRYQEEYFVGHFEEGVRQGTGRVHDIVSDEVKINMLFARDHVALGGTQSLGKTSSLLR